MLPQENQAGEPSAELRREIEGRLQAEALLRQSEREKAVVAERNRIARELHDSVTQSLYAMTLYADVAAKALSSEQIERARGEVQKLRGAAKDALGEMRLLIYELRPPVVAEAGLSAGLQARLDTVEKRSGLQTEFRAEGSGQLPPDVEDGLYRIAREALNNVLKHAHACSVTVSLRHEAGRAVLEITDDGVGFEPATGASNGGLGLDGMAERAQELGAQLTVDSESGPGTRIAVVWEGVNG